MSDQQFVLRWHYHETTLLHNLPCLLENDILSDVTLSVGSQHLRAHKIVLAMCSVYFLQLFQDMKNIQHPVVVLHNVSIDDIRAVLSFMYRGQCVVSKDQLPNLLSVAKLLKVQGLCDMKVPDKEQVHHEVYSRETKQVQHINSNEETICDSENKNNFETHYSEKNKWKRQCDSSKATDLSTESRQIKLPSPPVLEQKKPRTPEASTCSKDELLYSSSSALRRHSTHTKDISETCKCFLCGKYLSNQYNLRVHMETHEEAFHACQSCPHVSRSRDALRKHVSYRHPEEYLTRKRKKIDNL